MKFNAIHFMVLELFQAGRDGEMDMAKLNGTILKHTIAKHTTENTLCCQH